MKTLTKAITVTAALAVLAGCAGTPSSPEAIAKAFLVERAKSNCDTEKLKELLHPDLAGAAACQDEADQIKDKTVTCEKPDELGDEVTVYCKVEGYDSSVTTSLQKVDGRYRIVG